MIDWDAEADALAEGYWQSADGILARLDMLSQDVQLATFNGAVKIISTSFGTTDFIVRGYLGRTSCEWCINHVGVIYRRGWFMPDLPRHPGCPHYYDILSCPTIVECEGERAGLHIGKFCSIADEVKILLGGEHNYNLGSTYPFDNLLIRFRELGPSVTTKGDIHIGNDVWIGYGSIILSGVTIGDGAVIGAGSVVAKDIPPYAMAAGNPARVITYRFSEEIIQELLKLKWWDLPWNELRKEIPWLLSEIEKF